MTEATKTITISRVEYNRLVRKQVMLDTILNAQSYNRESIVAAVKATLDIMDGVIEEAPEC